MKLSRAIKRYIEMKRLVGVSFRMGAELLAALLRHTGDISLRSVTKRHMLVFLGRQNGSDVTRLVKYRKLKAFFDFWIARNKLSELPMPRPHAATRNAFTPYIYSSSEIRELLRCTISSRQGAKDEIGSYTLRTIVFFLYETGARASEVIATSQSDVDLGKGSVSLCPPKTDKVRTVPIGSRLLRALRKYLKARVQIRDASQNFFVRNDGFPVGMQALGRAFRRLHIKAGILRVDGRSRQPRLLDLRHTFAVHCLNAWLREGKDLRTVLPVLAAYMGHVSLSSTEMYLSLVPNRFWKQLAWLSRRGITPYSR